MDVLTCGLVKGVSVTVGFLTQVYLVVLASVVIVNVVAMTHRFVHLLLNTLLLLGAVTLLLRLYAHFVNESVLKPVLDTLDAQLRYLRRQLNELHNFY